MVLRLPVLDLTDNKQFYVSLVKESDSAVGVPEIAYSTPDDLAKDSAFSSYFASSSKFEIGAKLRSNLLIKDAAPVLTTAQPTFAMSQFNTTPGSTMTNPVFHHAQSGKFTFGGNAKFLLRSSYLPSNGGVALEYDAPGWLENEAVSANGDVAPYTVEFLSDAPVVELRFLGTSAPRFRIFIDGKYCTTDAITGITAGGTGTQYSPLNSVASPAGGNYVGTGKSHFFRITHAAGTLLRRYKIEFKFTLFSGVTIPRANTIYATRDRAMNVIFFGDSYTAGTGAEVAMANYVDVVGRILGWNVMVSGSGGTGYLKTNGASGVKLRDRLDTDLYALGIVPDLIVIAMGINDTVFSQSQVEIETYLTYNDIRTNLPNTPVWVLTPWNPTSSPGATLLAVKAGILASATAAPNVTEIIDVSGWIQGTGYVGATAGYPSDTLIGADGTHPTQLGHEWLGTLLAEAFADLLIA